MAISEDKWLKARGYYEAGLSLSKIKEKTGIARNTISQKAKKEQWEHSKNVDYIEAKEIVAEKKGTVLDKKEQVFLNCADEVADDKIRRKGLVFGFLENALKKNYEILEGGTIEEKLNVGDGVQNFEARKINPKETKELIDGAISIGKSFGVIEDKASVQIANQNQQNNNVDIQGYSVKTIEN